tara:strand:+ start:1963 stop:2232 length:270 start_codon:yes stop_codon:yes gene_type:complete
MYSKYADDWIDWDDITINNIREAYMQREAEYEGAKAEKDTDEMRFYDEQMHELLCRMTSDQRSLCLDDFDEIPLMFEKVMTKVKEEEIV